MTQEEQIVRYIEKHGSIDAWRAMRDLKIMRLASRVHDLKSAGVPIIGIMQEHVSKDGTVKRWKVYYIDSDSRRAVGA